MTDKEGSPIEELVEHPHFGSDGGTPAGKRLAISAAAGLLLEQARDSRVTLARVARTVLPLLADLCILDLVDNEGTVRCAVAAHILPEKDGILARARDLEPRPDGLRARVLRTGEPLLVRDVDEAASGPVAGSDGHLGALFDWGLRSILIVPLIARDATLGVLTFANTEQGRSLTAADLDVARQLANRMATAMDDARRQDEERRVLARAADRLARLQRVTAALATAATRGQVAHVVLEEGAAALGANAGIFTVVAAGGAELEVVMSFGLSPQVSEGTRLAVTLPVPLAEVVRSKRPVLLDSPGNVRACFPDLQRFATIAAGGLAAVPLQIGARMLGAFQFCFPADRHPCDLDKDFLLTVAELVAQCLDRVHWSESAVRNEQRFRTLADMLPQQIWIHTPAGNVEYLNGRALEYLGIRHEEGLTLDPQSFIKRFVHPEDQSRLREAWERGRQDVAMYEVEVRRRGADGTYRWHLNRAVPLLDDDGKVVRWFGTATDIDDQKRVEAALARNEARLRRMTAIAVLGVGLYRVHDGMLIDANDEALAILGYDREDLAAERIKAERLNPPEFRERDEQARAEFARSGACAPYEKELIRKDGSRVPVLHASALLDGGGEEGLLLIVDLTERKRLERAHAELVERGRLFRERILGIVGHDLRDPLATTLLSLELLIQQGPRPPAESLALERMHRSLRRMTRMVNALLDFARSREGVGLPIRRERIDLGRLCREVLDELSTGQSRPPLELDVTGPVLGAWDGDRLAQVVSNLANNAIHHGDRDRPVRIRVTGTETLACVEVHNWGAPIAAEDLAHLFDPFRTGQGLGRNHAQGAGLGLYIVREIVVAHGGTVEARSSADEGTVFSVRLPRDVTG
jgi:PAS domain S-box-containing protein